ncbi:MAG: hypothetical protein Q4G25_10280 [Paracoccus sp. (in: a-proteobacteria)]|nr:hypothetical protein [Paracoccus sp. (in: a-proteobacteria)]
MQIVYHLGAHASDNERLLRTLIHNREALWPLGTEIPSPNRYRGIIGEAINSLRGAGAPSEMQEMLLDALMDSDRTRRVVLSQSGFLGMPQRSVAPEGLYPRAAERVLGLSNLFPDSVVEFFMATVHPARQIAGVVRMCGGRYHDVMGGIDPRGLRWAPVVRRMLQAVPDREITIWAQEDLPFVWPEVLRAIAGVDASQPMRGEYAVLADLLDAEALTALRARLDDAPDMTIAQRRELIETALTSIPDPTAFEAPIDLPGWSQELIDALSQSYAEDLAEIAALPGVEFISA